MKNLFKSEYNKDIFKIISVLVFYIIFFGIFKAGLDYQRIIPARQKEKVEKVETYKYFIVSNGVKKDISFNETKSIPQILESFFEKNIQFIIIREGLKIESIYNSRNIKIKVNSEEMDVNIISDKSLPENSIIEVLF